jgi:hypothetical protein
MGGLRLREHLLLPTAQVDLSFYLHAFELESAGRDPYDEGAFLYPPPFVVAGAALQQALEPRTLLIVYRTACLLGVWVLVWVSLAGTRWSLPAQAMAALAVSLSPLLDNAFGTGNVSPLVIGLLVASLWLALRRPAAGGLALGTLDAFKPMGVSAVLVLATPSSSAADDDGLPGPSRGVRLLAARVVAGLLWLLVGRRHLAAWLTRSVGFPDRIINVSVHRALWDLGLRVSGAVPFAVLTALGMLAAWRWARTGRQRVALAAATTLLALPVVNPSTFLLALPAQALALETAIARWRVEPAATPRRRMALAALVLVAGAIYCVHRAEGAIAAGELPTVLQGLVALIPLAAVAGLTVYSVAARSAPAASG